jgi:hypothetical protein
MRGHECLPLYSIFKSPCLNPIEPKWMHAKKAVVEPDGLLSAAKSFTTSLSLLFSHLAT